MAAATRWVVLVLGAITVTWASAQDRETKVRNDKSRIQQSGYWIYNDLPAGKELARQTNRPLLVVFRCIPCEHCAQLDEQVVEQDPLIQKQLAQFVCVRVVHANGLDLSQFQYDYDQSWAAFFLNADMTIYGRYGTRSHQTESAHDVSLEGFSQALAGALELHRGYPANKAQLAGKHGPPSAIKVPEEFPSLKGKFSGKLDYEGQVVKSCIHCHQVGEALRLLPRSQGQPIAEKVLYPYPHPKSLGLIMDPKQRAQVLSITPESPAVKAGFQAGDEILAMDGQPILSIADMQWVFQQCGETATVPVKVRRAGQPVDISLVLDKGWRQLGDISWRATSWDLRRMTLGGMVLEELPVEQRSSAGLADGQLGLRVKHVGQYGEHAAAKKAGLQVGDVILAVDGESSRRTEGDLMTWLVNAKRPGERVKFAVKRGDKKLDLTIPMQ